jgi:hypothetical protein
MKNLRHLWRSYSIPAFRLKILLAFQGVPDVLCEKRPTATYIA